MTYNLKNADYDGLDTYLAKNYELADNNKNAQWKVIPLPPENKTSIVVEKEFRILMWNPDIEAHSDKESALIFDSKKGKIANSTQSGYAHE